MSLKSFREKIAELPFSMSLGLIIFALLTIYFQNADQPGFFQDGYLYAAFGKNASELGYWLIPHLSDSTYPRFDQHLPTLFILEGIYFKIFGASYLTARLFGLLILAIFVVSIWFLLKKRISREGTFFTLMLFLLLPPLMKKSRFPNLDIPLALTIFLSLYYYSLAIAGDWKKNWILAGFFFGLSMLIKGPMGFLIPLIMLVHLLFLRKINLLLNRWPWIALSLGFFLFSLWPISLHLTGNGDVFTSYLNFTFGHTIAEGRGHEFKPWSHLLFLLAQTGPWIILFFIAAKKIVFERKIESFELLSVVAFLVILVFLSIFKLTYSNYLIPLYPFLCVVGGQTLTRLNNERQLMISKLFGLFIVVAALILLVFPLTKKVERDRPLHKSVEIFSLLKYRPTDLLIVNEAYPFFAVANMMAFEFHANSSMVSMESIPSNITPDDRRRVVLLKLDEYNLVKGKSDIALVKGFAPILFFPNANLVVLIEKEYAKLSLSSELR